jgi:hypothetical protein
MSELFNALSGPELLDIICKDFRRRLEGTGEFKPNVTFPWVRYDFKAHVLCYPTQGKTDDPKIYVSARAELGNLDIEAAAQQFESEGGAIIDTPDKARAENNLPIPTPTIGPGPQIIDKLVVASTKESNERIISRTNPGRSHGEAPLSDKRETREANPTKPNHHGGEQNPPGATSGEAISGGRTIPPTIHRSKEDGVSQQAKHGESSDGGNEARD